MLLSFSCSLLLLHPATPEATLVDCEGANLNIEWEWEGLVSVDGLPIHSTGILCLALRLVSCRRRRRSRSVPCSSRAEAPAGTSCPVYPNGETSVPDSPKLEYFTLEEAAPEALIAVMIEPRSSACSHFRVLVRTDLLDFTLTPTPSTETWMMPLARNPGRCASSNANRPRAISARETGCANCHVPSHQLSSGANRPSCASNQRLRSSPPP